MFSVSLGTLPGGSVLAGLPQSDGGGGSSREEGERSTAQLATQASSLMALLTSRAALDTPSKSSKIWLGEGLGSIPKRTYDRMMKWEFIDMGELRLRTAVEKTMLEPDTQRVVVLPGFEVAQAKQKPITDIITWVHCYSRYTAAMATKFPDSTPGLMSHLLTVLRAYSEVEDPAWRLYDIAYREKMAAMGQTIWSGMDVQIYQEVCEGRPRRRAIPQGEARGATGATSTRRLTDARRPAVCWQFNEGGCTFGRACKFPHVCENCQGSHPKFRCPSTLWPS